MLSIFVDQISKRLTYTFSIIFEDRGVEYQVLNDPLTFKRAKGLKIVYSDCPLEERYPTISPASVLFDESIIPYTVEKSTWNNKEVLSFDGKIDVLASIFYIISLYDEYLLEEKDVHDRIEVKNAILSRMNWTQQLIVERWSEQFIQFIESGNNQALKKRAIPFSIKPTFDIDNTYAYHLKSGWRKWMSIGKDLVKFDKNRLRERKDVLTGIKKDPYDTFEIILDVVKRGFDVNVFWLLGDYAVYDRNIPFDVEEHQQLIQKMDEYTTIGLHPSYRSNQSRTIVQEEKERLENIVDHPVEHSRQHYLKLRVPQTYQNLEKLGFTDDYTLGFADSIGFRAGIARPFLWYNLKKEEVSNLTLHPITYMDGTLNEYLNVPVEEAQQIITALGKEVKQYGGEFIAIWHNETIGDYGKWKGWREVLEATLSLKK